MTLSTQEHARVGMHHIETAIISLLMDYPPGEFVPPHEIVEQLGFQQTQSISYTPDKLVSYVAQRLHEEGRLEYGERRGYRLHGPGQLGA